MKTKIIVLIMLMLLACSNTDKTNADEKLVLKIFHAGSLSVPFEEAEVEFERINPNIDVQREAMGSVAAIRQITEVGKPAHVLASADYSLIPSMMYPDFANWYVRFAKNDMVLAYNEEYSRYADEINADNWYEILQRDDVTFGFSNPNLDPCGYRAVMINKLADLYYKEDIFSKLIMDNTAITVEDTDTGFLILAPESLEPSEKVNIKPKETELVALLEMGGLDYMFNYRSVVVQHGLDFIDLPEEMDLSSVSHGETYRKVQIKTSDGNTNTASPIVYGITVPSNAPDQELGLKWVNFIISEKGQKIFSKNGQPPIIPAEIIDDAPIK